MEYRLLLFATLTSLWILWKVDIHCQPERTTNRLGRICFDTLPEARTTEAKSDETDTSEYITTQTQLPASFMTRNVGFVSEFIKRLNYQRTPDNQPMDSVNQRIYLREPYLRDLFDQDDPRLNPRSPKYSLAYKTAVDDFVTDVLKDTAAVFLNDAHEQLFAEIIYDFRYTDTIVPVKLYLKMFRTDHAYDWKILDSESNLSTNRKRHTVAAPTDSIASLFITSQTHETRFQNLFKHIQKRQNLLRLMAPRQPVSPTMRALAEAIQDSVITVERTHAVHLYLNTRRSWVLQLDDFVRSKDNAGWLIAELYGGTSPTQLPHPIKHYLHQIK